MELATLRAKHAALAPVLTERSRRVWAATEAQAIGYGGTALVARATGIATSTIQRGLRELTADEPLAGDRTRRAGGGRKRAIDLDATLLRDLDALVEPTAPGDPDSPLRWTCQSARTLAVALDGLGHRVSHTVVAELLHDWATACRATPRFVRAASMSIGRAVSVHRPARATRATATAADDFGGHQEEGAGRRVQERGPHLAPGEDAAAGTGPRLRDPGHRHHGRKAIPYGIYDLHRNEGWVSVGIDHDTASFAVRSIQRWWQHMGRPAYRQAQSLLITADAGGSNGARLRLWKWELQRLANRTGLVITVCHFPPGTSKWNKIEHRLFSHIAMNWRGTPLVDLATIVSLIGSTHSRSGLRVRSELDRGPIPGWHHRHRCAAGDGTPRAASLSRRLELHDPSRCSENTKVSNCLTSPNLRKRSDNVIVDAESDEVLATASDPLVLLHPPFLGVQRALGLANEVELLLALGDESPVRIVGAVWRVDPEPARQFDEQGDVLIVGFSDKCMHNSILSRSATPWEEAADVLVPASQR